MVRGQNPIPFALIGIGAAWLLMNNRSSRRWDGRSDYAEYDASWETSPSYLSSEDEFASPYGGEAFSDESGGRSGLGRMSSEARERATRLSSEARERAARLSNEARIRARRVASEARTRWDSMLQDNPMALGIAALAAGAVVGAALPLTDVENEYMGDARDNLIDSAKSLAHESVDSAKSVAKETIQKVTGSEPQRT